MGCRLLRYSKGVDRSEFRARVKAVVDEDARLSRAEMRGIVEHLLMGDLADPILAPEDATLLAALLTALTLRGETPDELCGAVDAMRAAATPIPLTAGERAGLVDTCGTGGDGLDTLNISTAAALVAAGAGALVAKHGNRAITSRCGSGDVLEALGVPITLNPEAAAACLRTTGFLFMLAPSLHPSLARTAPTRRALPFRTLFNLAGPLTNPAGAAAQVMGVYSESRMELVAEAMRNLGVRHAWVVHGRVRGSARGLDELTVTGESVWTSVEGTAIHEGVLWPESLGLRVANLSELKGGDSAMENAAMIEAILRGDDRSARREVVLLNAAAALVVADIAPTLAEGLDRAGEAVNSGAAFKTLQSLRAFRVE